MRETTELRCTCGRVRLEASKAPIIASECQCTSCRTAAAIFESRPDCPTFREANGGTQYVLYRKDRVRFVVGAEHLKELRLNATTPTRRVVATCCNTPIFLEFSSGHWLSLFASLWPATERPKMSLRTMTEDIPEGVVLDDALPNPKRHTANFFVKLLGAWIAMGFRAPKIDVGTAPLEREEFTNAS